MGRKTKSHRSDPEGIFSEEREIDIGTAEDYGEKPPWMIMERPNIIRCLPAMDAEREWTEVHHPAPHVRALRQSERLVPCQLRKHRMVRADWI